MVGLVSQCPQTGLSSTLCLSTAVVAFNRRRPSKLSLVVGLDWRGRERERERESRLLLQTLRCCDIKDRRLRLMESRNMDEESSCVRARGTQKLAYVFFK